MNMGMKEKIREIVKKHPLLEKYLRLAISNGTTKETMPVKMIKGKKNVLHIDSSVILNKCTFDIDGNNNEIVISASSILNNVTFFIRGDNHRVTIGQRVKFSLGGEIWMEDQGCEVLIGNHSTFESSHIAVTEPNAKIHIGEDCMFANDIDLRTGDSHSIIDATTNERINYAQNVRIGNHVWIASHVSILKGVHISDNSVVATRAVVTKSFMEPNILIGGMPAKKLKENINWVKQRIY